MSHAKKFLLLSALFVLLLAAGCVSTQRATQTPAQTWPNNLSVSNEAQKKAAALDAPILMLPENFDGWQLQAVQAPDPLAGNPFVFTYADGKRIFVLTEIEGQELSFQPAASSIGKLEGTIQIRNDIDATYLEEMRTNGKSAELKWREGLLVISLRSEQLEQNELIQLANALEYKK